jgi:hypothetical protein
MAWHCDTFSGTVVILFLDRSITSSCLSLLRSWGKTVTWLPDTLIFLRFVKLFKDEGIEVIWLFSTENVSSFLRFPISAGSNSEKHAF